jgi:thymidylate kinase
MSHSTARYLSLHDEMADLGIPMVFAYMDTDIEICVQRIKERRLAKGNTKPLNEENTRTAFYSTWGTYDKLKEAGAKVMKINPSKDAATQIEKILDMDTGMAFEHSIVVGNFK